MAIFWNILIIDIILQRAVSGPSYTPVLPPSYPLAVRNPYLSGESTSMCAWYIKY